MKIKSLEFKNENNDLISIYVSFVSDSYSNSQDRNYWKIEDITIKGFKKRKEISVLHSIGNNYKYRNLEFNSLDRETYVKQKYLEYVTEEQLYQAVELAWQTIKPIRETIRFSL